MCVCVLMQNSVKIYHYIYSLVIKKLDILSINIFYKNISI